MHHSLSMQKYMQLHRKPRSSHNIDVLVYCTVQERSNDALGMYSADGEYVEWPNRVKSGILVEEWFKQIGNHLRPLVIL